MTGSAVSLGLTEGPIRHQQSIIGLPIRATVWGQHIIDYISQGGGVFLALTLKEWNTNSKANMWPYGSTHGQFPVTGELLSPYFKQIVLTALAGTPAATEGPVTRTFAYAALIPGHNLDVLLGPAERNVSLVLGVLPQQVSSTVGKAEYFTDT